MTFSGNHADDDGGALRFVVAAGADVRFVNDYVNTAGHGSPAFVVDEE